MGHGSCFLREVGLKMDRTLFDGTALGVVEVRAAASPRPLLGLWIPVGMRTEPQLSLSRQKLFLKRRLRTIEVSYKAIKTLRSSTDLHKAL